MNGHRIDICTHEMPAKSLMSDDGVNAVGSDTNASPKNLQALKELGTYTAQIYDKELDVIVELLL